MRHATTLVESAVISRINVALQRAVIHVLGPVAPSTG